MRGLVLLVVVCLMLVGCLGAGVDVKWDVSKETPKMMSCHASYSALWRDSASADFSVCGGHASTKESKTSESAPSLKDVMQMYDTAKQLGMKIEK